MNETNRPPRTWTSSEAVTLVSGEEHEVLRFLYEKREGAARSTEVVEMTVRNRSTGEKRYLRFSGVRVEWLPPIMSDEPIAIENVGARGWESPRALCVYRWQPDGQHDTLFWAGAMEESAGTEAPP